MPDGEYPHAWESQGIGEPRKEVIVADYEYSVNYAAIADIDGPGCAITPKSWLFAHAEGEELYAGS